MRAVTFQSMVRTSSPGWYSRTSANSIPRPLKTEWYSPASGSFTSRLVRISIRRTFAKYLARECMADGCVARAHGTSIGVEHASDDAARS